MKRSRGLLLLLGGIVVILIIYILTTYNSFVKKEETVKQKWGDLNTTYQRRNDLVPNLVSVVKASSEYEKNVLTQVAEARAKASQLSFSGEVNFQDFQQLEQAQGEVANSVNRTIALVENYPDLKATKNFLYLQVQLEGTERRIKVARKDFNTAVADYNNSVRRFPSNMVAGLMGFRSREGFTATAGADTAPEINFKR
ncbi:MAG TPA: LemA family protein [Chitinophagaceae bacterium]